MTATNQNFIMYSGDTKNLLVAVTGDSGPVSLAGVTATWTLKESDVDTTSIITKSSGSGISVINGKLQIVLASADTQNLDGKYYHECKMTDSLGNVSTIFTGSAFFE